MLVSGVQQSDSVILYMYLFFYLKNFIYLWLCWVFVAAWGLSLLRWVGATPVVVSRLLTVVASLVASTGSRLLGFSSCTHRLSSCGPQALEQGTAIVAHGLGSRLVCGIFLNQESDCVPCIGRQALNHWTTREVSHVSILEEKSWRGEGMVREFGTDMYTLLYLKWSVALWQPIGGGWGGRFKREGDIWIAMADSCWYMAENNRIV